MIANYIRVALRNIFRSTFFSFINTFGLSSGIVAAVLVLLFVAFENSYDKFHSNASDIYRVELHTYRNASLESKSALTPPAVGFTLNNFPEVEEIVRIASNPGKATLKVKQKIVQEARAYIADTTIYKIFHFDFFPGTSYHLLQSPYDAIISETLAKKLFGKHWSSTSLSETIEIKSDGITGMFNITGVFRDFPYNSHFNPQIVVAKSYLRELVGPLAGDENWQFNFFHSYIKLLPGTDPESLRSRFNEYVAEARREELQSNNAAFDFHFRPIRDIHLKSDVLFDLEEGGDARIVYAFEITAIIIMAVAWINFINLSTAAGIRRAREVGVRKVLGAARSQLMFQFIMEALLINGFAILLSLAFISVSIHFFAGIMEIPVEFLTATLLMSDQTQVLVAIGIFFFGVLLSGIYPALILSGYNPVKALKSEVKPKGLSLRKSLIVLQTTISLIMIAGTFTVYKQVDFMRSTDLGIDIDKVLVVEAPEALDGANKSATNVFKSTIENFSFVKGFSMSSVVPGQEITFRSYNLSNERTKSAINCGIIGIDSDFFKNFGVELVAGNSFSTFDSLNSEVVINEEAARQLGFEDLEEAVGARVVHENKGRNTVYVIKGIVKNYHQRSLQSALEPVMFTNSKDITYYSIKLNAKGYSLLENTVSSVGDIYEKFFPGNAYNYFFLDQNFDKQYKSELKFRTIFFCFSILAVIISALGLLGLSTFMTGMRNKEVGIRKVMGADSWSIARLFLKDYVGLVIISMIIGIPLSYYLVVDWLQNFAFKISVAPLLFAGPTFLLFVIIFSVVGLQVYRAASKNPADVIREGR